MIADSAVGGPEFPRSPDPSQPTTDPRMTLRDYAAIHLHVEEPTTDEAEALLGRPRPEWDTSDNVASAGRALEYWGEARAKKRFLEADAWLRARSA